ncbi:MAG: glycosyltransferase family 4 protein [Gammaproteobacteria bacterium]|nr:glycosyltransferase family 4 protein [Gammaproteobacteria bacterium]
MNVLQVNSIFSGGGVDSQTLTLCAGLQQIGVSVWLATGETARLRPPAAACLGPRLIAIAGDKPHWLRRLIAAIRTHRIDLIHAHHGRDYWPAIAAARFSATDCSVLLSRHLMTTMSAPSRRFLLRFAHVAAVSEAVRGVLRETLRGPPQRLHQLYGGIDLRRFAAATPVQAMALRRQLGWPENCTVFALAAHLNPPRGKGHLEFVEAARRLAGARPELRFLIVGDGPMGDTVRAHIRAGGLESRVRLLPFCDDVERYLGAIDVLVHPAVEREALGIVLWEAMACGKPVIASRLDGIPETFGDGLHGLLVPPGEIDALTDAMRRLAADTQLRQALGAAGREHVRARFSQRDYAQRCLALYREILGQPVAEGTSIDVA